MRRAAAVTLGLLLGFGLSIGAAHAKTAVQVPYSFDEVWPSALRFVRLDRNWKLTEQDREAGFIRFQLIEDKRPHAATLELIRFSDGEGHSGVRLQLTTADLARYQEAPVLDALARKLREEQGAPASPKRAKEAAPSRDAATDGP